MMMLKNVALKGIVTKYSISTAHSEAIGPLLLRLESPGDLLTGLDDSA
jgi:hypothetical protein